MVLGKLSVCPLLYSIADPSQAELDSAMVGNFQGRVPSVPRF